MVAIMMMMMTDERVAEIETTTISKTTKIALILSFQYYHSSSEPLFIRSQACIRNLPKLLRTPLMLSLMEQPLTRAEPDEAGNNPVSMDIRVVFPAPFCPSRAVIWPSYMFSDTPLTATFFPIK